MKQKGVEVVGVSGDAITGLALFKKKEELNYPLLSDFDGRIAKGFGVPAGKGGVLTFNIEGKDVAFERGVTTSRWTFIVRDGKIVYKNDKVSAGSDSMAVLEFLEKQQK